MLRRSATGEITPADVLLALLWDPISESSRSLWKLGIARERVLDCLRQGGVSVPSAPLPAQREIEWGERVWFDRDNAASVVDHVRRHVPPAVWAFNYEGQQAWVIAESSVDLRTLVRRALAAT